MQVAIALLKNMRPKQWAKNGFVFAALVFDGKLTDPESLMRVFASFGLLCLTASTIYLINDLVDLEKDRAHPKKRFRPLASGKLPVPVAMAAAVIFPLISLSLATLLAWELAVVLVAYLVLHIVYSFVLKNIVLVDVFSIAAGFVLRVLAGVVVIEVEQFSQWLYVCVGLLSLFLAVGKRRQELVLLGDTAETTKPVLKQYNITLLNDMLRMTMTSAAIAYTLYAIEAETLLVENSVFLLTIPFVYYALFRYLYIIYVEQHGGDPTEVLFEDRPLQLSIVLWISLVIVLFYIL